MATKTKRISCLQFNPDYALGMKKIHKASASAHAPYLRPCRHSEFSKSVATLLVVSLFENLLGASRAYEDFAYRGCR